MKFYTNVAKGLKVKVKQNWLIHAFVEITTEKMVVRGWGGGGGERFIGHHPE